MPHNLELLAGIGAFHALGCAVVLGVSRKSTIAFLSRGEPPEARLPGSLAARPLRGSAGHPDPAGTRCRGDPPSARGVAGNGGELTLSTFGTASFQDSANPVGFRKDVEFLNPDAYPIDPIVTETGCADPLGETLA